MAKIRIRYNAEPQHVLRVDGQEIWGGKEGNVDAATAEQLAAADWIDVTIVDDKTVRWPQGHAEVDAVAKALDVELPDPVVEGRKPLLVAEKIALLEAAGHTPSDGAKALADATKKKESE
jgi:hypothetical protein